MHLPLASLDANKSLKLVGKSFAGAPYQGQVGAG